MKKLSYKQVLKWILTLVVLFACSYFTFGVEKPTRMIFFQLIGGMAIFLYGMTQMTGALELLAGDNIRKFFDTFTSNRFFALFTGLFVTTLIQSSSATTVMVVGFVNASIMNLTQAAGVIMGANIGTTVTGQLIAFKIAHYAYPMVAVGVLLLFTAKTKKYRMIGQVFVGFGLLFIGMEMMKEVVMPLKNSPEVNNILASISGNLLSGVIVGTIFTVILQSSSATVAVTMTMAAAGLINLSTAIAFILGDNIGTTITAQLAAMTGRKSAKRAALLHTVFNVFGVLIAMAVFPYYTNFVIYLSGTGSVERQIANAHTLFNVLNTMIFIGLIPLLVRFCYFLIPESEEEKEMGTRYLDKHLLMVPPVAIDGALREGERLCLMTGKSVEETIAQIREFDYDRQKAILSREKVIDSLDKDLTHYLIAIAEKDLSIEDTLRVTQSIKLSDNLESIADECENIIYIMNEKFENKIHFSDEARVQLYEMADLVGQNYQRAVKVWNTRDTMLAVEVFAIEDKIDQLATQGNEGHVLRLCEGICNHPSGYYFLKMMERLEKISDHCENIAELVIRREDI